jgi:hypothetical protein
MVGMARLGRSREGLRKRVERARLKAGMLVLNGRDMWSCLYCRTFSVGFNNVAGGRKIRDSMSTRWFQAVGEVVVVGKNQEES